MITFIKYIFFLYINGTDKNSHIGESYVKANYYNKSWEIFVEVIGKNKTNYLQDTTSYNNHIYLDNNVLYPQLYIYNSINKPIEWQGNYFNIPCKNNSYIFHIKSNMCIKNSCYNTSTMLKNKINLNCF